MNRLLNLALALALWIPYVQAGPLREARSKAQELEQALGQIKAALEALRPIECRANCQVELTGTLKLLKAVGVDRALVWQNLMLQCTVANTFALASAGQEHKQLSSGYIPKHAWLYAYYENTENHVGKNQAGGMEVATYKNSCFIAQNKP